MQSFVRIKRRFKFSGVGILFELTLFSLTCVQDGVFTLSVFTLSGISTVCLLFQTGWNTFVGALPGDYSEPNGTLTTVSMELVSLMQRYLSQLLKLFLPFLSLDYISLTFSRWTLSQTNIMK